MKKKIRPVWLWLLFLTLFLGLIFQSFPVMAQEQEELRLYSQSVVLMDGLSGRILYGKNAEQIRPMASTTKIMTCILALENGKLEEWVSASSYAASQPKVRMGVRKGEQYRLKDLLYGLMLESYNDAAVMIAEFIGGTREGFAAMMNEKARELGCKDTWFITPNGLDAQETDEKGEIHTHSTTAKELARILLYCIQESPKKEEFLKITRTQNHGFYDLENKRQIQCRNHNALLDMMDGALTGKTGFTGGAGYSYVGALEKNGKLFIIALLGCGWPPHKTWKWSDARSLLSYGMENYEKTDLYERCQKTEPLPVKVDGGICWGEKPQDHVLAREDLRSEEKHVYALVKKEEKQKKKVFLPKQLQAPVKEGQRIGRVCYYVEGELLREIPLYSDRQITKMTFWGTLEHIFGLWVHKC